MKIEVAGLCHRYGQETAVLDELHFELQPGLTGLLGPNGSGKSTLIRILAGLENPAAGQILADGRPIEHQASGRRRLAGYLPQDVSFPAKMYGAEILDYIAALRGISDKKMRRKQVAAILAATRLEKAARTPISEYSYGMKRRLGAAQALIGDPPLLLLDEPTEGMDPGERIQFHNLLSELAAKKIILLATHLPDDLRNGCHQVMVLRQGNLLFRGTPAELSRQASGMIWQLETDENGLNKLWRTGQVLGLRYHRDRYRVRYFSAQLPETPCEPGQEDIEAGYIKILGDV